MPETAIWSLITGLVLLALGLTYKWVENSHGLKLSEKEVDRLRAVLDTLEETRKNEALSFGAEINSLKEAHNKEISDIKKTHKAEIDKLSEHNSSLNETEKRMAEMHEKVLELLFKKASTVANICKTLKINEETARYYLEDLSSKYMVCPSMSYSGPEEWRIDQTGREYIMSKREQV